MKLFSIISVARQVDGEFVVIKVEKTFKTASKADEYVKQLSARYTENIDTPSGPVSCVCERGIFEIEVDDEE
ncbi:MAG: hypothetical protein EKK64_00435 [Neisseriaceae bacterium]|nr:MAG: hypothetical protein EKK64_00435 [Neisseriaceae bacterium]